jgi:hypothetical protein
MNGAAEGMVWCAKMWTEFLNGFGMPKEPYQLLAPRSAKTRPGSRQAAPDVTRNALLSFTTSLTKVSTQAHEFFSKLGQYFVFERMMRDCFGWAMPAGPAALGLGVMHWPLLQWFSPVPPQLKQQPKATRGWWGTEPLAPPRPEPAPSFADAAMAAASLPVLGAMLAIPAAFLTVAPAIIQAWSLPG